MEARVRIGGDFANLFGDEVGDGGVVRFPENVVERRAARCSDDVKVFRSERYLRQAVISAQPVKPALVRKERALRFFRAAPSRDDPDFRRHPSRLSRYRERVDGFGDDLRRKPGHREQDATRIAGPQ